MAARRAVTPLDALVWGSAGVIALAIIAVFYICTSSAHEDARKQRIYEDLNRRYRVTNSFLPSPPVLRAMPPRHTAQIASEWPTEQIPRQQSTSIEDTVQFERISNVPPANGLDSWYQTYAATGETAVVTAEDFLSGRHRGQI